MEEGKRNQLEARLKEMLENLDRAEAKKKQLINQSRRGNVILRRKAEKDKRFCI